MGIINICLTIVSLITAGLSLLIINGKKTPQNEIFSLFILTISLWSFGILLFRMTTSIEMTLNFANINYIIAAAIPIFFLHFSYLFPTNQKIGYIKKYILYIPLLLIIFGLILDPHLILKDVVILNGNNKIAHVNLTYYLIYAVYFISYVIAAYINLIRSYLSTKNQATKTQLKFIFIGTIIPYILATFFDLILPPFNYSYSWIGPLLAFIVVCVLVYSIYKHHFLNTKIITAEFFTISLWIFILAKILIAKNEEGMIFDILLLFLTIIFGVLLILSVFRESRQKDQLRELNNHLEQRVAEQTQEVKKAYELEKKAKRDLEKLNDTKDQFILITQHNLRTPVTSIRWELESILSGTHGAVNKEMYQALSDAKDSANHLTRIVDDFLNITALKVGSQILQISERSLKPLIENVLKELRIDIETKHITVDYPIDVNSWPVLKIDSNKIQEVLLIIIENAIRYNVDYGKITVTNSVENNIFKMIIENTGIGIVNEDKNSLFERLFFRSKRAQSANPTGMGIGLSVSKAILKAHHGDITISSEGENMGAKVEIALPVDFIEQINSAI